MENCELADRRRVQAAYRRGDLFDKRTGLMAERAKFCGKVEIKVEVVSINTRGA